MGSWCALMLLRRCEAYTRGWLRTDLLDIISGVSHLLLIDVSASRLSGLTHLTSYEQFDLTTLSSLNRHAAATLEDVGIPKVEATRRFLKKIAPWAKSASLIVPHSHPSLDTRQFTG